MKENLKRILLLAVALCFCLSMAFAEVADPATLPENAPDRADSTVEIVGNHFANGTVEGIAVGMDFYSAGETVRLSNSAIGASALLAARNISISGTTIGNSLRAAGYSLNISDCHIRNNATVAGYSIRFDDDTEAVGIYAACNDFSFAGTCYDLRVSAGTVTISGTVNGDAHIAANHIILEDGANITGTLYASSGQQPTIAAGAAVGDLQFKLVEETTQESTVNINHFTAKLWSTLFVLGGNLVLAVLYYFVMRRTTHDAGCMITGRPVAMPITGLVSMIVVPFATLLLMITVIGIPAALLIMFCYGLILAFSLSFIGCAAGQRIFPKMHPLVASLIGVAALTVLRAIPILGTIITIACMIYALGYFIQKIYLGFSQKKQDTPSDLQ